MAVEIHNPVQHPRQIKGFEFLFDQFGIQTRGVGNIRNQTVQTAHVMFDHIKQSGALFVLFHDAQGFHRRAQAGKGVFDFMRHIGGEFLVGFDALIQGRGHAAHGA